MTHEQLLRRLGPPVRAIVKRLRRKLGDDADDPTYIFTKRRVGYWMEKGETRARCGPGMEKGETQGDGEGRDAGGWSACLKAVGVPRLDQ